jgi:DAACS family dicarboxylate/amino acid:cation (Na+ or H+) symporter
MFPDLDAPWLVALLAWPIGRTWLQLLVLAVVPLAATSLALALADLDTAALARVGARALSFAAASSAVAALIGILLVDAIGPGRDFFPSPPGAAGSSTGRPAAPPPIALPALALALAAIGTGLAMRRLPPASSRPLRAGVERLQGASRRVSGWVMKLAPLGVAALLLPVAISIGKGAIRPVASYVAVVIGGLLLHTGVVYSLALRFLGGASPAAFFRAVAPAAATAFTTASSAATLPTALRVAEERLRLPPAVARLVLTAGSAMNQNGTSLFEGVTVLFLAQAYGTELSLLQQAAVMLIAVLAGIGSAGVPGGGTAAIAVILGLFGIPLEGVALIAGVDRLLDMCRTTVNVVGDLALAVIVSASAPSPPPGESGG